jgi:hypothetical protein
MAVGKGRAFVGVRPLARAREPKQEPASDDRNGNGIDGG